MLFKNRSQIIRNGKTAKLKKMRRDALDIVESAVKAVDPYFVVKSKFKGKKIISESKTFNISDFKDIYLIGFGKASAGMAQAVCDSIEIKKGAIITNEDNAKIKCKKISVSTGGHPIPDKRSLIGTEKILEIIKECGKKDLLIVLISGGGSSLFCKPKVDLKDYQKINNILLKSGADIKEINTIRKHLSYVSGGQLASLAKCTIISFIISDIIGDPIEFIASGPTHPDSTTYEAAKKILEKYNLLKQTPLSILDVIERGRQNKISETPKFGNPIFKKIFNFVTANNEIACKAAEDKARKLGYETMLLTTRLDGEARAVGKYLVEKATNYRTSEKTVFISGGETTVTVKGNGKGGRNQEIVLSSINELSEKDVVFLSFATDGIDGCSEFAGAIADSKTLKRARGKNLDLNEFLKNNNSSEFFKSLGDFLKTGPTGTNVMDIQLLIKTS